MRRLTASLLAVLTLLGPVPLQAAPVLAAPRLMRTAPVAPVVSLFTPLQTIAPLTAPAALTVPTLSQAVLTPAAAVAPVAPIRAPEAPVTAALPQIRVMEETLAPETSAPEAKANLERLYDTGGAMPKEAETTVASVETAAPVTLKKSKLSDTELKDAVRVPGSVPAPRSGLTKALTALYWTALTGGAVALHAPFDRVGPLMVGLIMAAPLALMIQFFMGAARGAVEGERPKGSLPPTEKLQAVTERAARSMGMPMPRRLDIQPGTGVYNAFVEGYSKSAYAVTVTEAVEALPEAELEGIVRHELAHIKHGDLVSRMAQLWLAPFPASVALTSGILGTPDALIMAFLALSALSFPFFQQLDEYQADQRAAATMEGPSPLMRFFVRDSDDERRAASAAAGKAFASEKGLKRAALLFWARASRLFSSHPAHDLRVARLARLAREKRH